MDARENTPHSSGLSTVTTFSQAIHVAASLGIADLLAGRRADE